LFLKRIEVGVSIYKVGGELSARGTNQPPRAQVGENPRGGIPPSLVGGGYVIYYNIFQFLLQKRYSEAEFVMKVAWKIALY
jgi:hypothetical protein